MFDFCGCGECCSAARAFVQTQRQTANFKLSGGLVLDARRALFVEETRTLVIADLHFGYAWAQRFRGQLIPLSAREDSAARVLEIIGDYQPREVALLGDIVHRAAPVEALKTELRDFLLALSEHARLRLIAGNHDRGLDSLLSKIGFNDESAALLTDLECGAHLLTHGDETNAARAKTRRDAVFAKGGRVIIGHEHPAITLSDGVAARMKFPCFLCSERVLVLPAFSSWAAGTDVRGRRFMSEFTKNEMFNKAFAVVSEKLLPVRL